MTDVKSTVLDLAHSTEVKKVGIIAVAALKDIFDTVDAKIPMGDALKELGDDIFIALGMRIQHLLSNQEAKVASVAAVTEQAPLAGAIASQ
jgi:3-dehydroquinate synthase class II